MAPPIIELIGVMFVAALIFFGEREIRLGRMDLAQFVLFLILLFRSYDPMRKLSRLHNSFSQALAAAQHVREVLDDHAEIKERPEAIDFKPLRKEIEFHDVHFGYSGRTFRPARRPPDRSGREDGGPGRRVRRREVDPDKASAKVSRSHSGSVLWDGVELR
jgi:subfamily B ATP-binding cassette protein MsbA